MLKCSYHFTTPLNFISAEDGGKSKRPAKVLIVGTHADMAVAVKKSPSGESTSAAADSAMEHVQG